MRCGKKRVCCFPELKQSQKLNKNKNKKKSNTQFPPNGSGFFLSAASAEQGAVGADWAVVAQFKLMRTFFIFLTCQRHLAAMTCTTNLKNDFFVFLNDFLGDSISDSFSFTWQILQRMVLLRI